MTVVPPPLRERRRIVGVSAVLLPFDDTGAIDWKSFEGLLSRTIDAGLTPAVNMDTGYVSLLTPAERRSVLKAAPAPFYAGAFVDDAPGDPLDLSGYRRAASEVVAAGGIPVVFPSFGLTGCADVVAAHAEIGRDIDRFVAFELGTMFNPAGRVYPMEVVEGLMGLDGCIGMKHSSLDRVEEWSRLALRDRVRPDFHIFTGNDLAIDMVMYGSDYLLGLSGFAPDWFGRRDDWWAAGDPRVYGLNDALQAVGSFAFREPVPAYKHSAAQFLHLRGWVPTAATHPRSPTRPRPDVAVLKALLNRAKAAAEGA